MPLSVPTISRQRLHERRVSYEGFRRSDGLFDIDAHIADVKDHDYLLLSGQRDAGEPVHEMHVRVTIDRGYNVVAVEACTDHMPYPECASIGPAYGKLVGANLVSGFRKRLHDALGGIRGCTHITELLGYLPTAAVQTIVGLQLEDDGVHKPFQLDRCHALESTSETVRQFYPRWYRGAA
jgi:hypothetical protein